MSRLAFARTVTLFIGFAACKGSSPAPDTTAALSALSNTSPPMGPIDHLADGELLEGSGHAFGLVLPRDAHIDATFADVVYASGPILVHPLALYFRSHLEDGDFREGDTAATFEHVRVPGEPGRQLRVHVVRVGLRSRIEIADTTPPAMPVLPDEASRWRQVGLTSDGHLADPTHLD